ncbi:glycosyltransferase [Massilia norwichensis]|uniref:Glycosyltransferase n=1 Tax=Massilia norwichensis TaxID=1442366 RepID=A0ABT2A7V8_9BURK|nr:glycosyltransferase [Massilia norwichensis]MCS0589905.1 glycosyltransferase [Massilia norwichensis]
MLLATGVRRTHFVVVTIGSAGDLFPFMAMALTLLDAGHRVSFLAPEQHEPYVRASGLPFIGLPADPAVLLDPDLWHPTRGFGVVWRATRPAMAQIVPFVDALPADEPLVLLVHPLALPEADLCRARRPGLKVAAAYLAPQNLPTVHDPLMLGPWPVPRWVPLGMRSWLLRRLAARFIDPVALRDVNAARQARGMPAVPSMLEHLFAVANLSITLFPDWFAPTQPDWPKPLLRADFPLFDPNPDAPLSRELEYFLEDGQGTRPVVFTHGTGNTQARAYFEHARAAVELTGLRAIFLTPHREQLPSELPPSILWQDYVPLRRLLPRAMVLVHHGGIGTTAEALRAGTPQLVVPLAHDQFDNAARVAALGVAFRAVASRLNGVRLARGLQQLLADRELIARCRRISRRFALGQGMQAVRLRLETLAASADAPADASINR